MRMTTTGSMDSIESVRMRAHIARGRPERAFREGFSRGSAHARVRSRCAPASTRDARGVVGIHPSSRGRVPWGRNVVVCFNR